MADQVEVSKQGYSLAQRILERIASDETFRGRLLDDPEGAMESAGFASELVDLRLAAESDAAGYGMFAPANYSLLQVHGSNILALGGQLACPSGSYSCSCDHSCARLE